MIVIDYSNHQPLVNSLNKELSLCVCVCVCVLQCTYALETYTHVLSMDEKMCGHWIVIK